MKKNKGSLNIGLGDVLKGLGYLLDAIQKMDARGVHEMHKVNEFEIPGNKKLKGVYGFRVRVGGLGEPTFQSFGNLKTNAGQVEIGEKWEPILDVFDEGDCILIVTELPGIDNDELQLEVIDNYLVINASGARIYEKKVLLPCAVEEDSISSTCKNGIIEIILYKK
jgi:HSP20 family protein